MSKKPTLISVVGGSTELGMILIVTRLTERWSFRPVSSEGELFGRKASSSHLPLFLIGKQMKEF